MNTDALSVYLDKTSELVNKKVVVGALGVGAILLTPSAFAALAIAPITAAINVEVGLVVVAAMEILAIVIVPKVGFRLIKSFINSVV